MLATESAMARSMNVVHAFFDAYQDDARWKAIDRGLAVVETPFQTAVFRAHMTAIEVLKEHLAALGISAALVVMEAVLRRRLIGAWAAHLPRILRHGWERGVRDIDRAMARRSKLVLVAKAIDLPFDLEWPALKEYLIDRPLKYGALITATTVQRFRELMVAATARGEGIDQITREIVREKLPGIARQRAETIARTEVISASNAAAHASYQASKVVGKKKWLHTRDQRTRDTHRYSGIVPVKDPFVLPSGARLMFPGDGSLGAPVKELANCRCAIAPVVTSRAA
jgi:hypothetical protein